MRLLRMFGVLLILGGVIQILLTVGYALLDAENSSVAIAVGTADLVSGILILTGMIALFITHEKASLNWKVSFIAAFIGTALFNGSKWIHAFVEPALMQAAPELLESVPPFPLGIAMTISFTLFAACWLYFGISSFFSKSLPATGSILVALGPVLDFVPLGFFIAAAVWGLGIVWFGLSMMNRREVEYHEEVAS